MKLLPLLNLNLFLNLNPVRASAETGKIKKEITIKIKKATLCSLLFAGLFFCGGCGTKQTRASVELPVFFTCDTRGRLEPCGCFEGQFGGLTRLKTVLDAIAPTNALRVDVGDAIGGREDYDLIEYGYMLRAFAAMNYDALNPGHREAQLAITQLHAIKQTTPVPIVSANLLDQTTGQPVFDSWRIIERGGFRIALIGVVDPSGMSEPLGAGVRIGDMESALTRSIAEVRPKSDLIVLLAFAHEEALAKLARRFYEAHLILGGKVRQPSQALWKENRSLIYFVTNESRALGMLRLLLVGGETPTALAHEIRLLHDRIPQDPSFHEMAQTYRDEVRRTPLNVDDPARTAADAVPGVRSPAKYVGSAGCVDCHPSAAAVWAKSGHAHAFATLQNRQADADPKCIACHTVGFGTPTGYRREFGAAKLVHVGCESCHGPGSLHVERRLGNSSIEFTYRPLDAGDCQKCHYGEFSRPFDWEKFWPPIKHGKEQATASTNPEK